jgi:hypothetical protein
MVKRKRVELSGTKKKSKLSCSRCGSNGHVIDSCNSKYHVNGDELSDQENPETFQTSLNESIDVCTRCGHSNHITEDCFAKKDIDGNALSDHDISSDSELETFIFCNRCGRNNHFADECFANFHVNGQILPEETRSTKHCSYCGKNNHLSENCKLGDSTSQWSLIHCERCGRNNHGINDCFAVVDTYGKYLSSNTKIVQFCKACGRNNHHTRDCTAGFALNGDKLFVQFTHKYCEKCGRMSHPSEECYAKRDVLGNLKIDKKHEKPKRELVGDVNNIFEKSKWILFNVKSVKELAQQSGIYEIAQKSSKGNPLCTYVGMSKNLRERLMLHHRGFMIINKKKRKSNIFEEKLNAQINGNQIFFRVLMTKIEDAVEYEKILLKNFDYAWNLEENEKTKRRTIQ